MGTKHRCTEPVNALPKKFEEGECQGGFTSGLFQGNNIAYPSNIKSMARYLSSQYPNNKLANQRGGNKGNKRKRDDSKSEDNNSNTGGTTGAHVEDTTINEDSTAPSGGASLEAHISERNQALSCQSRTVDEILGAHPVNDAFWDNTNSIDVSIDTANSEKRWREAILPNSTHTKMSNLL